MKNRKTCLISPEVAELLVKQLAHELKNYNLYKTFANFFSVEGIVDLQKYYEKRAEEEYNHHQWVYDYLTEADCIFKYPAIESNNNTVENYTKPFTDTIDREILTTQMLYTIYDAAISEKDYMTASWLYEKLIREQIEEENISRMAISIMAQDADIFLKAKRILSLLS